MRFVQDHFEKLVQSLLAVVQTAAEIADDLVPPAFGGAEGFQQFGLAHEIRLLIVAGHAGIADRRHVFVAEAKDFAHVVITDAALAAPIRDQLAECLPRAQGLDLNAQHLRRFPYLHERHGIRD